MVLLQWNSEGKAFGFSLPIRHLLNRVLLMASSSESSAKHKKEKKKDKGKKDKKKNKKEEKKLKKKEKKEREEELQRQSFEAALAAAAREREKEKHGSADNLENKDLKLTSKRTNEERKKDKKQDQEECKKQKPAVPQKGSGETSIIDAYSYDPTKKASGDYSKPDALSVANSGLDIQRAIYQQDRSEYTPEQLRRADQLARMSFFICK